MFGWVTCDWYAVLFIFYKRVWYVIAKNRNEKKSTSSTTSAYEMAVHQQAMNKAMNTVFTFSGDVYADWQLLRQLLSSFNHHIEVRSEYSENLLDSRVLALSERILHDFIIELQTTPYPRSYEGGSIMTAVERIVAAFRAGPENLPFQVFVFGSYGKQLIHKEDVKNLHTQRDYKVLNPDVFFTINEKVFNENQIFYILNLADTQNAPVAIIAHSAAKGGQLLRF